MTRLIGWVVVVSVVSLLASSVVQASYYDEKEMLPSPAYKEKEPEEIIYTGLATGVRVHGMEWRNITGREEMTSGGGTYYISSFFDIFTEVSTDGGGTWAPFHALGQGVFVFGGGGGGGGGADLYDTEMTALIIQGGDLPAGVQIRESPTRASLGQATCTALPGGGYMIDSFFDIFTEISTDGGLVWSQAAQSARIDGLPEPATLALLGLGAVGLVARRRGK